MGGEAVSSAVGVPVSPEERRRFLLARLERDGRLVAAEIIREIGVSEDTVRRDLNELAAAGLVQRVHGGALPAGREQPGFAGRETIAVRAKSQIGARAAGLIQPGSVVLLDSGTTVREVAAALPASLEATIVTTSLPLALDLCDHVGLTVVIPGGTIDRRDRCIGGVAAFEWLQGVTADLCLLGVCGFDLATGVTAGGAEEAVLKRAMIAAAARTYALVDTEKLGHRAAFRVCAVERLTGVILDDAASAGAVAALAARGLDVRTG